MGPNVTPPVTCYLAPAGGHCNVTEGPPRGPPKMGPGGPPLGAPLHALSGPSRGGLAKVEFFFSRELFGFDWASRVWFFPRTFWLPLGIPSRVSRELFRVHWAHPSRFFPGDFRDSHGHPTSRVPRGSLFPRGNESPVCPRARFFPEKILGPAGSPGLPARGVMHAIAGETACPLPCPAWFTRQAGHGIQGGGGPGPCGPPHDGARATKHATGAL